MSAERAGRRAVVRWAIRLFRREWRQQLLILVLLTVVVGAGVAGSAVAVNAESTSSGEFGDAGALIRLEDTDAQAARPDLATIRERFGTVETIAHASVPIPGTLARLDVRDQDPHGPYGAPMLARRSGRLPTAAGEVALTRGAARLFDAEIGSTIEFGEATAVVVGLVENPADLGDDFALVAPGTLTSADSYTVLLDLATPVNGRPAGLPDTGARFSLRVKGTDAHAVAATVLAGATLALALVGLVAAAGFAVLAHRRQRQLGLLAAIGASDRHVRLVMVANGVIVGLVAAAVGTLLGIAGWLVAAPAVESAAGHRIDRFDLPWGLSLGVVALAVVMATLAAWWPARTASRLPVVAALSGRPAAPHPVHRSLLVALVLVAGGITAIALAEPTGDDVRPYRLTVGLLAVVIGTVFAAPAGIRVLGSLAPRLPFAPRLALRDLARFQARTAAALAAITLGLGVAVAVVGVAAANVPASDEGNLSDRELLVQVGNPRTAPDPTLTPAQQAQLDQRAASVIAALGDGATGVALDVAFRADAAGEPTRREPIALAERTDPETLEFVGFPYIATPAVLALYGIDPASIDDGIDLLTARDHALIVVPQAGPGPPKLDVASPPSLDVDLPSYESAPRSLVTEAAVRRQGWVAARAAWIVESRHPLTAAQITAARRAAADAGLAIEVRSAEDGMASLRTGATLVGGLLALAIVAMAVGLIRSESGRDLRTLTATGADARTRRALTASAAAALSLVGVLLGMVGAYLALVAAFHSDLGELVPLPVADLVELAVGLPLAATVAGWLLAGRTPPAYARQALD